MNIDLFVLRYYNTQKNMNLSVNHVGTGESETFLQKAIQQQGRASVMETIQEIQERHDTVKEIERNLNELHQVFLDMAVLVQSQGEQLDDIESHVARANSYVRGGVQQLQVARKHQKNTRKWTFFAIILLLIIILIIVLPIVLRNWLLLLLLLLFVVAANVDRFKHHCYYLISQVLCIIFGQFL